LAYLVVFCVYLAWVVVTLSIGCFLADLLGFNRESSKSCLNYEIKFALWGFLGVACLSGVAIAANFFIPISSGVSAICLLIGASLFVLERRQIFRWIGLNDAAILAALLLYTSLIPMGPVSCFDTNLYHLQSIKWTHENPLPLGLANLHGRFGFNSSWFPLASIIELPALVIHSPHFLCNSLAMFLYGSAAFLAARRCFSDDISFSRLFLALTAIPWAAKTSECMNSPSPDLPVTLVTFLIIYLILNHFENESDTILLKVAALLSAFAVTIKLSAAPIFPFVMILLVVRGFRPELSPSLTTSGGSSRHRFGPVFASAATALVICLVLGLWVARGVCLSGCIAYPAKTGCFNELKWTVPGDRIAQENDSVRGWAREPGPKHRETLSDWKWLPLWLKRHLPREKLMLILLLCGIVLTAASVRRGGLGPAKISPVLIPTVFCAAGVAFWFIAAPDPRFGYGFLFSFVLLVFSQGVISSKLPEKLSGFLSLNGVYLSALALGTGSFILILSTIGDIRAAVFSSLASLFLAAIALRYLSVNHVAFWILFGVLLVNAEPAQRVLQVEDWNRWSKFQEAKLTVRKTDSGMSLYVAQDDGLCRDAPLPCARHFDPRLRVEIADGGKFRMFSVSEK
jgi:hypothetical protein